MARLQTLKPRLQQLGGRLATVSPDSWRSGKKTAERGYGGAWQRARLRFLADHPLCVMCQAEGRVALGEVVDHRVPHRGDESLFWNESNWQTLCRTHHSRDKQRQENEEARK